MQDTGEKINIAAFKAAHLYKVFMMIFLCLGVVGALFVYSTKGDVITVMGTSSSASANKQATFTANVLTKNASKEVAVQASNEKAAKVIEALEQFGIDKMNLKTTNVNIYQNTEAYIDNGVTNYRPSDWTASVGVEIKLKDVSKASDLAVLLSTLETSDVYGPNYTLDQKNVDEASILASALDNAYSKALKLSKKSGKRLGSIVSINEGTTGSPSTMYKFDAVGMGGGGGLGLEPGSTEVTRTVTVTYRLW